MIAVYQTSMSITSITILLMEEILHHLACLKNPNPQIIIVIIIVIIIIIRRRNHPSFQPDFRHAFRFTNNHHHSTRLTQRLSATKGTVVPSSSSAHLPPGRRPAPAARRSAHRGGPKRPRRRSWASRQMSGSD